MSEQLFIDFNLFGFSNHICKYLHFIDMVVKVYNNKSTRIYFKIKNKKNKNIVRDFSLSFSFLNNNKKKKN